MWRFVDGAKTAGELYGRALVVIAAEQYASRLVRRVSAACPLGGPLTRTMPPRLWPSWPAHTCRRACGASRRPSRECIERLLLFSHSRRKPTETMR
jgi:hypothetical protein